MGFKNKLIAFLAIAVCIILCLRGVEGNILEDHGAFPWIETSGLDQVQMFDAHKKALGIHLGSTHITASTIVNESTPLTLGRQLGSQSYQDFMGISFDYHRLSTKDQLKTQVMLQQELEGVVSLARKAAREDLTIGTITYPRSFTNKDLRWPFLWNITSAIDPTFEETVIRLLPDYMVTMSTSLSHDCPENPEDFRVPGENFALMFDYNYQQLQVYLLSEYYGGVSIDVEANLNGPSDRIALQQFLLEAYKECNESNITTVFLSSDDSSFDYTTLERMLRDDFPALGSRLHSGLTDPEYLHSVAAARNAKYHMENPRVMVEALNGGCTLSINDELETWLLERETSSR